MLVEPFYRFWQYVNSISKSSRYTLNLNTITKNNPMTLHDTCYILDAIHAIAYGKLAM